VVKRLLVVYFALEVSVLGKDEEKGIVDKTAEKTGELVGKCLKKGLELQKGLARV
jgi:hypothetical protein